MPSEEHIRNVIADMKEIYSLRKVSIFGSYAEGRTNEASDLDLLVEFNEPTVSLIRLNDLKYALEDALGLPVDVLHAPLPENSFIKPGKVVNVL